MDYALNISTDKEFYDTGDDVKVTATFTNWPDGKGVQIRLVIWEYHTNNHITDSYYPKPATGETVTWTVPSILLQPFGKMYDAQIEYYAMHADVKFTH